MTLQECTHCDYIKNAPDGICSLRLASDGLSLRCVGEWSKAKHYYLRRYIHIFTAGMRLKWRNQLYYIDLFSGPGKCRVRETEEEIDGSPLLALNSQFPFAGYFFVEVNKEILNILSERCKDHQLGERIHLMGGDCNEKIDEIMSKVPSRSLSLAFIDPTGLHFRFSTIKKLATRKTDLIITFPQGMAINRNIKKFLKEEHSPLDDWMGDREWRQLYQKQLKGQRDEVVERGIIGYYRKKLETVGYKEVRLGDEIPIRSVAKNLPLYCLVFASRHPLGYKFWKDIAKIEHTGQRRLF
ncbi:three-Cys-motif partner protein TcmP [bacterium]|nr:three-Cys-motif partner protein TcmP [bacterium]